MPKTIPEVFIIESPSIDDEDSSQQEGEILSKMLHLSGKSKTKYFYIRTKRELGKMIKMFDELKWSNCVSVVNGVFTRCWKCNRLRSRAIRSEEVPGRP